MTLNGQTEEIKKNHMKEHPGFWRPTNPTTMQTPFKRSSTVNLEKSFNFLREQTPRNTIYQKTKKIPLLPHRPYCQANFKKSQCTLKKISGLDTIHIS